jgi:hypothetical protein
MKRSFLRAVSASCFVISLFLFVQIVEAQQRGTSPGKPATLQGKKPISAEQMRELKSIGAMIGRGEPQGKVETSWKKLVAQHKDMDIEKAVEITLNEAKEEAGRNVKAARDKSQKYGMLTEDLRDEIARVRSLQGQWKEGKPSQAIYRKVYVINRKDPSKTTTRKGNLISNKAELNQYMKELEGHLETVGEDAQLAKVDLQNTLQKQQQLIQMLSNVSKMLHDTATSTIRKIG